MTGGESQASRINIRNMKWYSLAQLLTMGPSVIYTFIAVTFVLDDKLNAYIADITGGLANISGFINALIFFFQRREGERQAQIMSKDRYSSFDEELHSTMVGDTNL